MGLFSKKKVKVEPKKSITAEEAAMARIVAQNKVAEARIKHNKKSSIIGCALSLLVGPLAYAYTKQYGKLLLALVVVIAVPPTAWVLYALAVLDNTFFASGQFNKKLREENPTIKV